MASQNDNNNIDPMFLDRDTIIVEHPLDKTALAETLSSSLLTASFTPSTPSLIETIPLRRFSYV